MADDRLYWKIDELLPIAGKLADVIMNDRRIQIVAVTGSLARSIKGPEENTHDVDIVALHNGALPIGIVKLLPRDMTDRLVAANTFLPISVFDAEMVDDLERIRGQVPFDFILAPSKALWSCKGLWTLKPHEYFKDFYL